MKFLLLFFLLSGGLSQKNLAVAAIPEQFCAKFLTATGISEAAETNGSEEENYQPEEPSFSQTAGSENRFSDLKRITYSDNFRIRLRQFYQQNSTFLIFSAAVFFGMFFFFNYNRRKLTQRLQHKRHTLHQHTVRAHAILDAEDKERKRIGLELHDGLGQLISIAKLNLSGLQEELTLTDETHKKLLRNTLSVLDEAFKEVRSISHNLAAGALQQQDLSSALRHLLDTFSQTDRYEVNFETVGFSQEKLPHMVEKVIYRVVQESLNNILKHAHASIISVQLIRHEHELTLMIEDNGTGFDQFNLPETEGIGLKNIRSRIEYLNGTFHIDSVFKRGTILTVEIPLAATHPQRKKVNEKSVAQHPVAVS